MTDINQYIDQTVLKPDATRTDILQFLDEVIKYRFFAAVVNPCWVPLIRPRMPDDIKVCSVVGFPLGACTTDTKVYAAENLIGMGCDEVDMVLNIGRLKDGDFKYVGQEIRAVARLCKNRILKVIIETCLLTDEEKIAAAKLIRENGAQYVKTSTGFVKGGATPQDVRLLRSTVGPDFGVKASGGIRTYNQALQLIEAGANRLGTSNGVAIVEQAHD